MYVCIKKKYISIGGACSKMFYRLVTTPGI